MYRILFAIFDGNMHEQRKTRSGSIIESTRSADVAREMKKTQMDEKPLNTSIKSIIN